MKIMGNLYNRHLIGNLSFVAKMVRKAALNGSITFIDDDRLQQLILNEYDYIYYEVSRSSAIVRFLKIGKAE